MTQEQTESLFKVLNESAKTLEGVLQTSYLDAFIETGNNLLNGGEVQIEDGLPSEKTVKELQTLYSEADYRQMDAESVRRAIQLCMLAAIKDDDIQANHQLTPDTLAYIMGYLVSRIEKDRSHLTILDPAVGTGNLLTAVINQLKPVVAGEIDGFGIDNDDTLLSVAGISAAMQRLSVDLVHQDAMETMMVKKADLIVSDLPIGYYPIDENVVNFDTHAESGHSYVHHLFLEQSVKQLVDGGIGVFLVPAQLFQSEESAGLLKWMQSSAYLQGLLTLPSELFINASARKSILILQKSGNGAKQAKKVMLGEFPSFKDQEAFQKFIAEIVQWEERTLLSDH
ncbi:class I SAM-dependent methyltransferase [Levilactobacillus bambusae]|uniref:class I SAM-dependent methyltransferase n=1 Tax=Levilactobacillus bambusae TaxID=2024736 RepID=UPI00177D9283